MHWRTALSHIFISANESEVFIMFDQSEARQLVCKPPDDPIPTDVRL